MGHIISHCSGHRPQLSSIFEQHSQGSHYETELISISTLSLMDLPVEIFIYNILPYVTYLDLYSLSQVNKKFYLLINTNDQLWKNAIKTEMLDEFLSNLDNDKHEKEESLPTFESFKAKFQYLYKRRQQRSWISASILYGCGNRCGFCETLYHKYITIRPSINIIQQVKKTHKLYIYFSHGEPQNNLNENMLDMQSQFFVAGSIDYCSLYPTQSRCLKCNSKCYYPSRTSSQVHPYNWFISYSSKKYNHERYDILEVYCDICKRFSLWRRYMQGVNGFFKPPKSH